MTAQLSLPAVRGVKLMEALRWQALVGVLEGLVFLFGRLWFPYRRDPPSHLWHRG